MGEHGRIEWDFFISPWETVFHDSRRQLWFHFALPGLRFHHTVMAIIAAFEYDARAVARRHPVHNRYIQQWVFSSAASLRVRYGAVPGILSGLSW